MNRIANLLLLALLLLIPQESRAWSSTASKTSQRVMVLTKLVEEYRVDHGKLPSQEQFQEGLRPEGYPSFENGYPFLDMWHRRILYKIPGKHGEYDLYSVGGDGIDDGGGNDDISTWNGVNEGYHWKRWWPLGRITLMATLAAAFLIFLSKAFRPWRAAGPVAGAVAGFGISFGCLCLKHPGVVPAHNFPLSIGVVLGLLILLSALWRLLAPARG